MFRIQERFDDAGAHMVELATGKFFGKNHRSKQVVTAKVRLAVWR